MTEELRGILESSGVDWTVVAGARHDKLFVAGRMVQTLKRSRSPERGRGDLNMIACVRRAVRAASARPTIVAAE